MCKAATEFRAPTASEDPNIQCDLSVTTTLKPSDLASPNLTAYFVRRRKTLNVEVLNFNVKKLSGQNLLNIL